MAKAGDAVIRVEAAGDAAAVAAVHRAAFGRPNDPSESSACARSRDRGSR